MINKIILIINIIRLVYLFIKKSFFLFKEETLKNQKSPKTQLKKGLFFYKEEEFLI